MRRHGDRHDEFRGLDGYLISRRSIMDRRNALRLAASMGALTLMGCTESTTPPNTDGDEDDATCTRIPEETTGPFPADGSDGVNVLNQPGIVRSYIPESFGGLTGIAEGIRLDVRLTLVSASTCIPLAGHAIYLWHCDRGGRYSLYTAGAQDENYLRGVQETDAAGKVYFSSIFPGCRDDGRWPHLHFEVFPSLASATNGANKIATSQIALSESACSRVYAEREYQASLIPFTMLSLETDSVFSDGSAHQVAGGGNVLSGFTVYLTVAV